VQQQVLLKLPVTKALQLYTLKFVPLVVQVHVPLVQVLRLPFERLQDSASESNVSKKLRLFRTMVLEDLVVEEAEEYSLFTFNLS
jgi:hypothetical protein